MKGSGGSRGNLLADRVSFHKSALKVASQISAGEVDLKALQRTTAAETNALRDSVTAAKARGRDTLEAVSSRLADLDAYDMRFASTVTFDVGSADLSADAKRRLDDVAARSRALEGYLIEIAGFADGTGSSEANDRLSAMRAHAVLTYLTAVDSIPLRRFAAPAGLGTARAVAANDTRDGRAMNRRVEVRVLVNRGLQSPPSKP